MLTDTKCRGLTEPSDLPLYQVNSFIKIPKIDI